MGDTIYRLVQPIYVGMTDDELRKNKRISVYYILGDSYRCDLEHLDKIYEYVICDFPKKKRKEIQFRYDLCSTFSSIYAGKSALVISVSMEEFINLRRTHRIMTL